MHTLVTESDSHKMISKFEEEKVRLEISDWSSKSVTEEFLSSLSQVDIYGFKKIIKSHVSITLYILMIKLDKSYYQSLISSVTVYIWDNKASWD